jgi:cyclophilin family peptidyl-prolyl cis-trans isomerase
MFTSNRFVALALTAAFAGGLFAYVATDTARAVSPTSSSSKKKMKKEATQDQIVLMETSKGPIKMQIFVKEVPITSNNFLDLVQKGFYNGLTFHRYDRDFVIQGGCPKGDGTGNYVDPQTGATRHIPLEVKPNLKHDQAGIVAMARSSDPNSASCQFYITLAPASHLDGGYAVFGKVTSGLEAVKAIRKGDKIVKVEVQPGAAK